MVGVASTTTALLLTQIMQLPAAAVALFLKADLLATLPHDIINACMAAV